MTRTILIFALLVQSFFLGAGSLLATEPSVDENRVFLIALKMQEAFKGVKDYHCDVEQIFYQEGSADQHFQFKFYFKKNKKIRVDFGAPYPQLSLFYLEGEDRITLVPLRFARWLRFRLSPDDPKIQTPAGQRINQTDMGYFIDFLIANLRNVPQKEDEFEEDGDRVKFLLWAMDYIKGKSLEKYRIIVSKQLWLPIRIERYDVKGTPLEAISIEHYAINTGLDDQIFLP
jgi:outer membrane lipoprotein-sorting protein